MKKEDYQKIQQKIPTYEELDNEFEISTIDTKSHYIRAIRKRITSRIENLIEILQNFLHPEPGSFIDNYECSALNEQDRTELFELVRTLMHNYRHLQETTLKHDDNTEAETINETTKAWKEARQKAQKYLSKVKQSWKKELKTKEIVDYMG